MRILSSHSINTPEEMMALGADMSLKSKSGDFFALVGELGAGKTHWVKGFISQINKNTTITSPTFAIVNEYPDGKIPIFHFDFYRLKSERELIALGWDEYMAEPGIILCEWADLFLGLLPQNTLWVKITLINLLERQVDIYQSQE